MTDICQQGSVIWPKTVKQMSQNDSVTNTVNDRKAITNNHDLIMYKLGRSCLMCGNIKYKSKYKFVLANDALEKYRNIYVGSTIHVCVSFAYYRRCCKDTVAGRCMLQKQVIIDRFSRIVVVAIALSFLCY